jgi:tetratricopeptide (TPR) repeat protein
MSEAHQVLTDPRQRQEYDEMLASGGGAADEQEKVQAVLRATLAFQRAEILVKKQNYEAAEREAQKAVEDDPEQADHVALLAWIEAQKPGADYERQIRTLSEAVKKEPNNQRIRWYRGQLYKRIGKQNRAVNDFRTIIELNPNHVEAAREIRLHEMRRTSSRPPQAPKGIGKWFKR